MDIIVEQAIAIEKLNSRILELVEKVEKLKVSRDLDSFTSSKPPSGDILKKTENKQEDKLEESEVPKRKPGGQPGHPGKTRKGFGRIDRFEILRPTDCVYCGKKAFASVAVKIEKQSVAQLVEHSIEIVEYQRQEIRHISPKVRQLIKMYADVNNCTQPEMLEHIVLEWNAQQSESERPAGNEDE